MSSSYKFFVPDRPRGDIQSGILFGASTRENLYAVWTSVAMGMLPAFDLTVSGGTAEQPTTFLFSNASEGSPEGGQRIRGVVTWGADGNISTIVWSVSQDSAGSYATVATQTFSYDSNGNFVSSSGASGLLAYFAYILGRVKLLVSEIATINVVIATLQGMAFQDESAVAITGGSVLASLGSSSVVNSAYVQYLREKRVDLGGGTPANTFTLDFAAGGCFICSPGNDFTFAINNPPPTGFAQKCQVVVKNAAGFTATLPAGYTWGGAGAPVWTTGLDIVTVYCLADATNPVKRFMLSSYG